MENRFDELTKALSGGMPRREALRRIAGGFAGALLASLGIGKAWGAPAPNSFCEKFCRDECGVNPGSGNAFGKCVSSCQNCLNHTGILPVCPAPGTTEVICGTCPSDCSANACGTVPLAACGQNSVTGTCLCAETNTGGCACFQPICLEVATCSSDTDCPSGFACVVDQCCGAPICAALCGTDISALINGRAAAASRAWG